MLDKDVFKNPPKEYRGVPFWSINDILYPDEIRRQIRLLDKGGYGGVFFHAREGLVTPFLSEKWFEAFEAAVDEAKKRGMYVWIYDELWWPSGFAGGIVPAKNAKYRAKALVLVIDNRAYEGEDIVAVFKCKVDEKEMPLEYEKASPGEASEEYLYLNFVRYVAPVGETWFSGFSYVDLLDEETVREFINAAYRPYAKYREEFGKTIPGVFTDEPNISASRPRKPARIPPRGPRFPVYSVPWTDTLPEKFRELNGYDILEKLPELFLNIGDYTKTRYDFWRTVTTMFLEAFSKQIYEWCDRHGLKFTGHYLAEDSLLSQLICSGATMPHYEYQHVPGIDHLGMEIWHIFLTVRQVASVANQLNRKRVLCEVYGCTGYYPSFEDRKWLADFLLVQGVNLLNHHLVPYSLRGRRKRDYGLMFHWSQPWWKYNTLIELYFARVSYALTQGKRVVNVLVIHPITSAWIEYSPLNSTKVVKLDEDFKRVMKYLLRLHVDFDLGDELIMEKHGKVENAKIKVGEAEYHAVIIPPSVNLSQKTVELLRDFVDAGGLLIAFKPLPTLVSGNPSEELADLWNKAVVVESFEELASALEKVDKPVVIEGDDKGEVLYHLRSSENSMVLFIVNTSRETTFELKVGVKGSWKVEEWDPITGENSLKPAIVENGQTWIRIKLYPVNSKLFVLEKGSPATLAEKAEIPEKTIYLNGKWKVTRKEPNVLVLDYCRYRVEKSWSPLMPVPRVHDELCLSRGVGTKYTLRFEFESELETVNGKIMLAVENPKMFKARVNGVEVELGKDGHWLDWNFGLTDITKLVGKGLNTIELESEVTLEHELENIYIIGDFAVEKRDNRFVITAEKNNVSSTENLCTEGYLFYSGTIDLETEFLLELPEKKKIYFELDELNAALAVVYVNGTKAGEIFLRPYKLDISDYIKNGYNKIRVVLVGTLRNTLGPLHNKEGDPKWTDADAFISKNIWTDKYMLRPFGFKNPKVVLYKETL